MKHLIIYIIVLLAATTAFADNKPTVQSNVIIEKVGDNCLVSMQIDPSALKMKANRQMFITPYLESGDGQKVVMMPSVVLSGRNMHYHYLRTGKTKASGKTRYNVVSEMLCDKDAKTYSYNESVPLESWMLKNDAILRISVDTCGCGRDLGSSAIKRNVALNPVDHMLILPYPTPVPEKDVIAIHQGKARVQFEVDKFELHDEVYNYTHRITKRKHTIDNREQLQLIDDSLHYALRTPNVELVKVEVCGYASPESPYDHNEYLALNRSKAVMLYLEKHDGIPDSICSYTAVPENWAGFREQVLAAKDITEKQRKDLLALIDRPTHSPMDYDRKETELGTLPTYAELYKNKIHPDWFPELRYTQFAFYTHLKPLSDEQLREVMETTPEMMSLNQYYRLANLYEHGSEDFHKVMLTALKYYSDDETCNANAAALAIEEKDYEKASQHLLKAGDRDDANVLRGIVEVWKGNFDMARTYFEKAKNSPEAQRNLNLLK